MATTSRMTSPERPHTDNRAAARARAHRASSVLTVLVADPDQRCRRTTTAALRHGGYTVESARSTKEALSKLRRQQLAAIIVDPVDVDPAELIRDLRTRTEIPIIVVSNLVQEHDRVALLDAGADDCISKPFGVEELLARLRAALRRADAPRDDPPVTTADFVVDLGAWRLRRPDGSDVQLTPTEWRIVEALVRRPDRVVGNGALLEEIWGAGARLKTHYLRVHMAAIRRKVEPDPAHPRYFVTYPGLGHMFRPSGQAT